MASRVSGGGQWDVVAGASGAPTLLRGYLRAVAPDDYEIVAGRGTATHAHIQALAGGEITVVPLAQYDDSVRMLIDGNDILPYGYRE